MDILSTLKLLNACHGPSGDESEIAHIIRTIAGQWADEWKIDTMGNLMIHRSGTGPKVMFAAHMDTVGLVVTHIEKEGFLRFGAVGGVSPSILYAPVRFKSGVHGLVAKDGKTELGKLKVSDLYIDIGAKDEEEASAMVSIGDVAIYNTPTNQAGSRIISPYLDNRISCTILLKTLELLGNEPTRNDLYFVFTCQEELGQRGAKTAAFSIDPDYAVSVDVTISDDTPNAIHNGSSVFGKGAAIKVMDQSVICHPAVVEQLKALAAEEGIPFQMDVIRSGGTDAGAIHVSKMGVYTGGISVPCRYIHSPVEMVETDDVEACVRLITAFANAAL
jgi:putative aminopeptidase FrvX